MDIKKTLNYGDSSDVPDAITNEVAAAKASAVNVDTMKTFLKSPTVPPQSGEEVKHSLMLNTFREWLDKNVDFSKRVYKYDKILAKAKELFYEFYPENYYYILTAPRDYRPPMDWFEYFLRIEKPLRSAKRVMDLLEHALDYIIEFEDSGMEGLMRSTRVTLDAWQNNLTVGPDDKTLDVTSDKDLRMTG